MAHGKKYLDATKLVDHDAVYAPAEAAELVRQTSTVNFDPSVEAHIRLGVDPRHADQMVRGTVVLPHGTGKVVRVVVFAQGEKAQEALRNGADEVGAEDLVKKIEAGWTEFDVALATPDTMGMVGRLGKVLGRKGLMPNPKSGTITFDIERALKEVKGGRVEFKVDKGAIIHVAFGKGSFEADELVANLAALIDAINRAKPAAPRASTSGRFRSRAPWARASGSTSRRSSLRRWPDPETPRPRDRRRHQTRRRSAGIDPPARRLTIEHDGRPRQPAPADRASPHRGGTVGA